MDKRTTEQDSKYNHLEKMTVQELLTHINAEDQTVPLAVQKSIPQIELLVKRVVDLMKQGGRLFYIGAGTSGRLGIVDASECPPTFGVSFETVIGLIAGGDTAIRKAVENAEDDMEQAWKDLQAYEINSKDTLVGIAASGSTPYVLGGVKKAKAAGIFTACIVCNTGSAIAAAVDIPIEVVVGPEFVTGSTRMKSGTAQKLTLNMLSTAVMIQLGKVRGSKMVDMQLSNDKLVNRAVQMIMKEINVSKKEATLLLETHKSVRKVIDFYKS